jgi:hypothetical protein
MSKTKTATPTPEAQPKQRLVTVEEFRTATTAFAERPDPTTTALTPVVQRYEARLVPTKEVTEATQATLPAAPELSNAAVGKTLFGILKGLVENGVTPTGRQGLAELKRKLTGQTCRIRALRKVFEADPSLIEKENGEISEALDRRVEALVPVQQKAIQTLLTTTTPQREGIVSLHAMFDTANCDGNARHVYLCNVSPTTDETATARGEWGFKDLPRDKFIKGTYRPFFESAVDEDGKPYPVTFVPLTDKLVWQTRGTLIVLGGELVGLNEATWWGALASKAGAVVLANVHRSKLCNKSFGEDTAAELRQSYSSDDPALKSVVICGNNPIAFPQARHDAGPVTVLPSYIYAGKLYGNAEMRRDLSFTNPPTNPVRDRITGVWFSGEMLCPDLRDRAGFYADVPLALLMEVSNTRVDGINVCFSSSRTAYEPAEHTCELELGTSLARAIVLHRMTLCKGKDLTDDEAEAEGRALNSIFCSYSGTGKPFLFARCDASKSRVQPAVQRDDEGNPILDENGEEIPTGRKEMVHEITIEYREGAENFVTILAG